MPECFLNLIKLVLSNTPFIKGVFDKTNFIEIKFDRHILIKILNVKFHENTSSRSRNVSRGRTDRQDEVIFAFHSCFFM